MRKILTSSVALLTVFFLSISFKSTPDNHFRIGNKEWNLRSAEIANESYGTKSKFELNLESGANKLSDTKTFIWLSLASSTTYKLTNGLYEISEKSLSQREPHKFSGSVFINDKEIKIVKGTFSVNTQNDSTSVNMSFELANGDGLTGSYKGKFSSVDRSRTYE